MIRTTLARLTSVAALAVAPAALAGAVSDGSDGPLHVTVDQTLVLPPDGIFNFTTITIDAPFAPQTGVLSFQRNAANTPVFLRATGDVVINGTIDVSAVSHSYPLGSQTAGPGGGDGGDGGVGATPATNGDGPSPGLIGGQYPVESSAGGAGGLGTAGSEAIRHTGSSPGAGGAAVPFPDPLTGGSGGAGGSGAIWFGLLREGGFGGGAGGALRIETPGNIIINGSILVNGAWGEVTSPIGNPRPGGGGSGGVIDLNGASVVVSIDALLQAVGGPGGGLSTLSINDPNFSSGATGGDGYIRIVADSATVDGTVDGVLLVEVLCPEDLNGDGVTNVLDLVDLLLCFGQPANPPCDSADVNGDGTVNVLDLIGVLLEFGTSCP